MLGPNFHPWITHDKPSAFATSTTSFSLLSEVKFWRKMPRSKLLTRPLILLIKSRSLKLRKTHGRKSILFRRRICYDWSTLELSKLRERRSLYSVVKSQLKESTNNLNSQMIMEKRLYFQMKLCISMYRMVKSSEEMTWINPPTILAAAMSSPNKESCMLLALLLPKRLLLVFSISLQTISNPPIHQSPKSTWASTRKLITSIR